MEEIILASGSPRRKELLQRAGVCFRIVTADTEEETSLTDPQQVVAELSKRKAKAVLDFIKKERPAAVIGADTIVSMEGKILGKPHSKEDAMDMLRLLSGKTHQVYTGVTVYYPKAPKDEAEEASFFQFVECTNVTFYPVSDAVLSAYIDTGEPMDKAGAYGIQGTFGLFVKGIEGDIDNVIGLPVPRLLQEATRAGVFLTHWQGIG